MLSPEQPRNNAMVLRPYDRKEALSLREAAKIAGVSESTVRNWCSRYDIGRRVGNGPWQISRVALAMFLDGNEDALNAYLAGGRTVAEVAIYYTRFGLPVSESDVTPKDFA